VTNEPRCLDDQAGGAGDDFALVSHVQSWAYENVVPLNASIEVTLRCNIRCLHCYNFDRDEAKPVCDKPELSTEEILGVMDDLRAAGTLFLMLTGGEVLSHPELFRLLDHARTLKLSLTLATNGTMLRPELAARLASYENLQTVTISVYGATPEIHDAITQMPGSWQRTWDGARRMRDLGVGVRIKLIVMKQNAHEVAAMRALADAQGFKHLVDMNITPRHDGSQGSLETRVDLDQMESLYRGPLRDLVSSGKTPCNDETLPCNCARGNVGITATGDVHPCVSVPWTAGNVREQPFAEIWKSSPVFQRIRGLKLADYETCAPCEHKDHCRRDRGAAFNSTGSYTGTDPFICASAEVMHRIADERSGHAPVTEARPVREAVGSTIPLRRLSVVG
jgi:AdoMet-dependent heme synthase